MALSTKKIAGEDAVHYVSLRKRRERGKVKMQPPMTPMIDVTFQLLLFFLLATNFRTEGNIPGSIPPKGMEARQQVDVQPINVVIRQVGWGRDSRPEYAIETSVTRVEIQASPNLPLPEYRRQLAQALFEELQRRREQTDAAIIKPQVGEAGYVRWGYVVEAYSQTLRAAYKNVGFAMATDVGGAL